jgi:N6-adenosine-specific RNA methylase IME4
MKSKIDKKFETPLLQMRDGLLGLAKWGVENGKTTAERFRLARTQRDEQVLLLRANGLSQREIATLLNEPKSTVARLTAPNGAGARGKIKGIQSALAPNGAPLTLQTPAERREAALREQLKLVKTPTVVPDHQYGTIVIDPPWPMKKIEREVRPNQVEFDYPTMDYEELRAFRPIFQRLAAASCHVFMWTTQRFLPMALRLFEDYDVKYVLTMVWHKSGGFQPVGLPQYNCEFVLYGRIGTPEFNDTTAFDCCFEAPRTEHSRKPNEFYELVRRVTIGECIDVFSREAHEGFDQFGNEVNKFDGGEHIRDRSSGRAETNATDNGFAENAIPISRIGKRSP